MAKRKSKGTSKGAKKSATKANGTTHANGSGAAPGAGPGVQRGKVQTVTFRIPSALKRSVEQAARDRGMTTTRFVVQALENEVNEEPPRWWGKARSSGRSPDAEASEA